MTAPAHALLSASGAHIWLNCPESARLTEDMADEGSEYSRAGTKAHEIASAMLLDQWTPGDAEPTDEEREMIEAAQEYADFVRERHNAALAKTKDAELLIEQRLDYSDWVPEGFGTGDALIIADGALEVIDFKYGVGVPVKAENNPQLRLYGAGAWSSWGSIYTIDTVQTTIHQPRLDSITTDTMSVEALQEWLDTEVAPKAQAAWNGTGGFKAGDHCRFCKALPTCRTAKEHNMALAAEDFAYDEPPTLTVEEIAEVLNRIDTLTLWAKSVQDHALKTAVNDGIAYPGWKVVEGRSNRTYTDQDAVAKTLMAAGYAEAIIYERNLLGITAMEKTVGKKKFKELLTDHITKPPGAPKLAPLTDKRPPLNSGREAAQDFAE